VAASSPSRTESEGRHTEALILILQVVNPGAPASKPLVSHGFTSSGESTREHGACAARCRISVPQIEDEGLHTDAIRHHRRGNRVADWACRFTEPGSRRLGRSRIWAGHEAD
jgi:hypothetical protein